MLVERLSSVEIGAMDVRVAQIAGLLGYCINHVKNAKYDRDWRYLCFVRNGRKGLCFSIGDDRQNRDRLFISGEYPKDESGHDGVSYGEKPPKISVSLSKQNGQIASDIQRRFIPEYEALFRKAQERVDKTNEYARKRRGQIADIALYLGCDVPKEDGHGVYLNKWGVYRIEPYSDSAVKFEVQVDAKKAIEVLEVLRKGVDKDGADA
jgi:hypothetical protein